MIIYDDLEFHSNLINPLNQDIYSIEGHEWDLFSSVNENFCGGDKRRKVIVKPGTRCHWATANAVAPTLVF